MVQIETNNCNIDFHQFISSQQYEDQHFLFWFARLISVKNPKNSSTSGNSIKDPKFLLLKGTAMQIEKALTNDCLHVSKISWKFRIPAIYSFAVIYLWNLLFS